jgi:CheY-like chemotaxis protein/nitrogen-specific signal transduction histidine kinase
MLRVSTFRDVSAEHAIRDRLEQASRDAKAASQAKSNFLATISHELRTPLNAVLGYAQLLEAENQDPKARDMLGSMRASSEHLLSIVSDILDFTKSDDGGISLLPTGVDPRALLAEAVARQRTAAKEKGLQLTLFEPPTPCPRVLMDGRRFQQIADHLLDNAVRFTAHGQVDARLEWAEEARGLLLSVAVRDTGPGIAADLQPRLFSPFTQGDGSMTRQHGGLGIGLAVSRRIAKAMDGDLQVSTGPGGTTMTLQVRVPRDPAPPPATPASPVSTPPVTNGHNGPLPNAALEARVLVAEDDPVNQKVIGRMLEKCGQTVALVSDGLQAVEAAGTKPYKLILMDVHMPNLDGLEATRRIRAAGNKVSIVALTADALVGDRQKCLEAGMDEYLSKPVRLDDLRKTIERFVTAR